MATHTDAPLEAEHGRILVEQARNASRERERNPACRFGKSAGSARNGVGEAANETDGAIRGGAEKVVDKLREDYENAKEFLRGYAGDESKG